MRSCNGLLLGFLNVLALAFSIFQIIYALMNDHDSIHKQCYKKSSRIILWISIFLLIMSLIGLMASYYKSRVLQSIYFCVVVISTIVSITFTAFIFAAIPNGSANATWHKSLNGNWLKEFSPLLRKAFVNRRDWFDIRTCLVHIELCEGFRNHSADSHPEREHYLHYLELGCCIPPKRCGFRTENETYWDWEIPDPGMGSQDNECQTWGKKRDGECYDCDSCKAGYIAKFQTEWRADKGIYIGIIVILIIDASLSFYALKEESDQEHQIINSKYERNA